MRSTFDTNRSNGTMPATAGVRYGDLLHGEREPSRLRLSNVTDSLYDELWRRLVNLEFEPGKRLSDDALAREFGVSRTPVREALLRLSQVGLVQSSARRGFFVTQPTRQSIEELFDLRTALESWAVRQATPHIIGSDLTPHLPASGDSPDPIGPGRAEAFVNRLAQSLRDVSGQLAIAVLRLALTPEARAQAQHEHARIVGAILLGDPHAAAAAMEEHIQQVKFRSLEAFHL
jgi:DNA-binding GntR family transcriptional regulator